MKALTFHGIQQLKYETVDDPVLRTDTDALIKVNLAAICGSDLHVYNGREVGLDKGTVMGHEFMGEVLEVGSEVQKIIPGQKVISPFFSACGECYYCGHELSCRCKKGELFGWVENGEGLQGTQAEYVRVPLADSTLNPLPEGLSDEEGLLLGDILPTAFFCAEMAESGNRGTYAVIGCGPVGLLCIMALMERGANEVYALEIDSARRSLAQGLGATAIDPTNAAELDLIFDSTDGRGVDSVLEAVGNSESQRLAYQLVRKGGILSVVGVHNEMQFSFSPNDLYNKNLSYRTGRCPVQKMWPEAIEAIRRGKFPFESIVSHRLALSEGVEAYANFNNRVSGWSKVILIP